MRLIAIGDLSLNGRYHQPLRAEACTPLSKQCNWDQAAVVIGNLESPITMAPRVAAGKCTLRGSPNASRLLEGHQSRVFSLANNHMMDFGEVGMTDTIQYLERCGVAHCGAGLNLADAQGPLILEHLGERIAFLAYCNVEQGSPLYATMGQPGVAPLEIETCCQDVIKLRDAVDWVVVHLHWGREMSQLPTTLQRWQARRLIQAGADVILGHHPHVLQPIEYIDGGVVAYSLGNFLFSDMFWRGTKPDGEQFWGKLRLHPLSRETGWLECTLDKGQHPNCVFHPALLARDGSIVPDLSPERREKWQWLNDLLTRDDYQHLVEQEHVRAAERHHWRWSTGSVGRSLEMLAFRFGLLGRDAEGF